jgi:general stress protein YciG
MKEIAMTNNERGGSGNFANDPKRASEAGKKGGEHSRGHDQQQQSGSSHGQQGGSASSNPGNFANDREKASEAGRKGGQS